MSHVPSYRSSAWASSSANAYRFRTHPFGSLNWEMNLNTINIPLLMAIMRKRKAAPQSQELAWPPELGCGILSLDINAVTEHQHQIRPLCDLSQSMTTNKTIHPLIVSEHRPNNTIGQTTKMAKRLSNLSNTSGCCCFTKESFRLHSIPPVF